MRIRIMLATIAIAFASTAARADLEIYKDYTVSDAVWAVTTIKVKSNMGDAYLEGLKKTWVPGNEISKSLGQIEDYWIYGSDLAGKRRFQPAARREVQERRDAGAEQGSLRSVHGEVWRVAVEGRHRDGAAGLSGHAHDHR